MSVASRSGIVAAAFALVSACRCSFGGPGRYPLTRGPLRYQTEYQTGRTGNTRVNGLESVTERTATARVYAVG